MTNSDFMDYDEEVHEALTRWVTFRLDKEIYGVEVACVNEILRLNKVLPVPGAPDYILGITNIRGNVVTVIDGRKRINVQTSAYTAKTRMIILESENDIVAVVVDDVVDIVDVNESSLDLNPKAISSEDSRFVTGIITYNGSLIIALGAARLITDETMNVNSQINMAARFLIQ